MFVLLVIFLFGRISKYYPVLTAETVVTNIFFTLWKFNCIQKLEWTLLVTSGQKFFNPKSLVVHVFIIFFFMFLKGDIKKYVDKTMAKLINPRQAKQSIITQVNKQISDMEKFVSFLNSKLAFWIGCFMCLVERKLFDFHFFIETEWKNFPYY